MTSLPVSVVVPAFNEEKYLGEALASVCAQSYPAVEVLVVDDGSSDATAAIADSYGLPVLCQPHKGVAAARNAGLAATSGPYWAIFDADDIMPEDRLEQQVAYLESHPGHDLVTGLAEAFVTPGQPRPAHWNPAWDAGPYRGHPGTMLARRSLVGHVGLFDEALAFGEDIDWLARAKDLGASCGRLEHLCLRYRVHEENYSSHVATNQTATLAVLRRSLRRRREGVPPR